MRRAEIPDALLKARRADIDRIPDRVLAKMTRGELAGRLVAASEYRRRASVPHLDGDLYRHRLGLASEVLTTDDPKRAAELMKAAGIDPEAAAAGVPAWVHRPFTGQHMHLHPAHGGRDSDGDGAHEHLHTHSNDNVHDHRHAVKAVKGTRPGQGNSQSASAVHVDTPALDQVGRSRSLDDGLTSLLRQGRLGEAAAELAAVATASAGLGRAGEYRRKAALASSGEDRSAYLRLAEQLETAGSR